MKYGHGVLNIAVLRVKAVEVNSEIVTLVTECVLEFDPKLCSLNLLSCFLGGSTWRLCGRVRWCLSNTCDVSGQGGEPGVCAGV